MPFEIKNTKDFPYLRIFLNMNQFVIVQHPSVQYKW